MRKSLHSLTPAAQVALRSLKVDRVTAEVVDALRRAGLRPVLLKGPSFAQWLYAPDAVRGYGDSDLLLSPDEFNAAQDVLKQLGFVNLLSDLDTPGWRQAAYEWSRPTDEANVDLHRTIAGVAVEDRELWNVLSAETVPVAVAGCLVEALPVAARTLHVALHAAQDGVGGKRTLSDLERALQTVDENIWRDAAELARQLRATNAFATGVRLRPAGRELAERLSLPASRSTELALLASTPPPAAMAWEHFAHLPGWPERSWFIVRKVFPTRRLVRSWAPVASRGHLGLVAAYIGRPFWLLWHAWPGFIAWRRARGEACERR